MLFTQVVRYCSSPRRAKLWQHLYGDRAFMVAAPKLWNALPVNIRDANNVDNLKRLLKTYFFKLAYT